MITQRQLKMLIFINDFIKANGYSPSYEEIKIGVGLKSKSGVHAGISEMAERGLLRINKYKARCIEVVRFPKYYTEKRLSAVLDVCQKVKHIISNIHGNEETKAKAIELLNSITDK